MVSPLRVVSNDNWGGGGVCVPVYWEWELIYYISCSGYSKIEDEMQDVTLNGDNEEHTDGAGATEKEDDPSVCGSMKPA